MNSVSYSFTTRYFSTKSNCFFVVVAFPKMYNRVQRLPEVERNIFREFYQTYLGAEALREDLGECYIQAAEAPSTFPSIFIENLEKVHFFYEQDDPRKYAIECYL